jgi:predicted amidohydrolase
VSTTRKVNLVPTQEDVLGLRAASKDELTVVDTGLGRLGTLVCYDGFREAHTAGEPGFVPCAPVLDALGAEVVAQPSANAWAWEAPWVFNEPGEHQLRSEQWFSEGMARQLPELRSVRYVVNPQLVGDVLDNHFEAPSLILERRDAEAVVLAAAAEAQAEDVVHARVAVGGAR